MRLKSLRIQGFKSFADRTTLEFREGVTAIVGSNGCGKSNTADAIRWVLGEQRASALRGSKMEEVIFQGTARRRPLQFAEVALTFENDRGRVAIPQSEIEVSRKVFREGGSEYFLNRQPCRLRDVHNLLRDTGLGSNAYAIIEAGMIETLLSDRAEERRLLFEEAAGIGRYKDSRQAAMRRLEAADGDLARLQDLIAEVEAKVRTLARQRRRAERHRELRARRLELEVALARAELGALAADAAAGERRHAELEETAGAAGAERAKAELRIEELRAEAARLGRERVLAGERLERVRADLEAREREMLVARERRAHAELRIQQLVRERGEQEARRSALASDAARLRDEAARHAGALEHLRARAEGRAEENAELRAMLQAQRAAGEEAGRRARDLAREIAAAEGARLAAERRGREAEERAAALGAQRAAVEGELRELGAQTELFASRSDESRDRVAAAAEAADLAREEGRVLRARLHAADERLRHAEDLLSRLDAQVAAREALERALEGFAPAVAAVLDDRARFPGVRGPLVDFLDGATPGGGDPAAVETFLGPLLQALVVDDLAAARELRRWFREEWRGGGSLLLLPLDAIGAAHGGEWAASLLREMVVVGDDPLAEHVPGTARVRGDELVEARGVVRLAERGEGEGILVRREALGRLRAERDGQLEARSRCRDERASIRAALEAAEERALEAEELRRVAEAELRRLEHEAAAHHHRHGRLREDGRRLDESLEGLLAAAREAAAQLGQVEARLATLAAEVEAAGGEEAGARARLGELEARWEEARDEESELRVAVARAEADLRETERRLRGAEQGGEAAAARLRAIDQEAGEQRAALEGLSGVSERAGGELEELFRVRDRATEAASALDSRLAELEDAIDSLAERVRAARRRESEAAEERHRIELRLAELRSRAERAVERLEVEWGRPFEALDAEAPAEIDGVPEEWTEQLRETARQLDALGPVNALAVEEHAEEARRLDFLAAQRDDLVRARDDLVAAIRQINRTARDAFLETFDAVRENFRRVFQSLFQGGECDVRLADPDDPLESAVEIQASPKGKRTQRIHLLSGGERTLTALALLFALYLVKPSPFCVLDEVDAPLDESNVGRFIQLLHDFKADTQFIVITHNPRTMEAADWVYGVTMEEPGVSSIVGVELLGKFGLEDRVA